MSPSDVTWFYQVIQLLAVLLLTAVVSLRPFVGDTLRLRVVMTALVLLGILLTLAVIVVILLATKWPGSFLDIGGPELAVAAIVLVVFLGTLAVINGVDRLIDPVLKQLRTAKNGAKAKQKKT